MLELAFSDNELTCGHNLSWEVTSELEDSEQIDEYTILAFFDGVSSSTPLLMICTRIIDIRYVRYPVMI